MSMETMTTFNGTRRRIQYTKRDQCLSYESSVVIYSHMHPVVSLFLHVFPTFFIRFHLHCFHYTFQTWLPKIENRLASHVLSFLFLRDTSHLIDISDHNLPHINGNIVRANRKVAGHNNKYQQISQWIRVKWTLRGTYSYIIYLCFVYVFVWVERLFDVEKR